MMRSAGTIHSLSFKIFLLVLPVISVVVVERTHGFPETQGCRGYVAFCIKVEKSKFLLSRENAIGKKIWLKYQWNIASVGVESLCVDNHSISFKLACKARVCRYSCEVRNRFTALGAPPLGLLSPFCCVACRGVLVYFVHTPDELADACCALPES